MIITELSDTRRYYAINPLFEKAFEWLKGAEYEKLEVGKIDIDGDKVYASVQKYATKDVSVSNFETHRKYIDIQLLIAGTEIIDYAPADVLEEIEPYNEQRDYHKLTGQAEQSILLKKGNAVILFPEDGHRACQHPDGKTQTAVEKIVIKVML